jgi:hypothetical protein
MDEYNTYPHLGNPLTDPMWVMRHSGTYQGRQIVGEIRYFAKDFDTAVRYSDEIVPAGDVIIHLSRH